MTFTRSFPVSSAYSGVRSVLPESTRMIPGSGTPLCARMLRRDCRNFFPPFKVGMIISTDDIFSSFCILTEISSSSTSLSEDVKLLAAADAASLNAAPGSTTTGITVCRFFKYSLCPRRTIKGR